MATGKYVLAGSKAYTVPLPITETTTPNQRIPTSWIITHILAMEVRRTN
jgi:hypothetical protein